MRKEYRWILLLSLFTVLATPLLSRVTIKHELPVTYHGLPFAFLEQHTTLTPLPENLPREVGFLDPRENPTHVLWEPLLMDLVIVSGAYLGLWNLIRRMRSGGRS